MICIDPTEGPDVCSDMFITWTEGSHGPETLTVEKPLPVVLTLAASDFTVVATLCRSDTTPL